MKLLKQIFFILICSAVFLVGCPVENKENSQSQNQEGIQQLQRIYFDYPVRDEPIGKTENGQLYWDCCSDNDFCDIYNGEFHSGEDWNLKGGRNDIDEGRLVYSIGEGKVIYSKEEKVEFIKIAVRNDFFPNILIMILSVWKNNLRSFAKNKNVFDNIVKE